MSKLDEVKETLNSLRAYFAVVMLLIVTIGGGLVSSYRTQVFDVIFWGGIVTILGLIFMSGILIHKIKLKTQEIKEL